MYETSKTCKNKTNMLIKGRVRRENMKIIFKIYEIEFYGLATPYPLAFKWWIFFRLM